jgi:hypothetical protein
MVEISFRKSLLILLKTQIAVFFFFGCVLTVIVVVTVSDKILANLGMAWFMAGLAFAVSMFYYYSFGLLSHRIFLKKSLTGVLPTLILSVFLGVIAAISYNYTASYSLNADLLISPAGAIIFGYAFVSCALARYFTLKELKK